MQSRLPECSKNYPCHTSQMFDAHGLLPRVAYGTETKVIYRLSLDYFSLRAREREYKMLVIIVYAQGMASAL